MKNTPPPLAFGKLTFLLIPLGSAFEKELELYISMNGHVHGATGGAPAEDDGVGVTGGSNMDVGVTDGVGVCDLVGEGVTDDVTLADGVGLSEISGVMEGSS